MFFDGIRQIIMAKHSIALILIHRVRSLLGKIRKFLKRGRCSVEQMESFYKLSGTCQIPRLAVFYEMYFGKKTNGCFVEVGAYDGEYVSNTSGLADIGWKGYYIEPVFEYYQRCKQRHAINPDVTVSHCAIGAESGEVEIRIGGPLSTIRNDLWETFKSLNWGKGNFDEKTVRTKKKTLEEYLEKHQIKPHFELLSVDVEGSEWEVFRSFDLGKCQPQMVIIELHDQNPKYPFLWDECNKIVEYFDQNDYKVIFKNFSNTIYVLKNSYPKL